MAKATKTQETKQERKQAFALWKRKAKSGKSFFTGKAGELKLTGFYNTEKKNLKEPDIRIYTVDKEGNLSKEEYVSLWCNSSKNGKKYLTGKFDGQRLVGFINEKATEENKQPYVSVYFSEEKTSDLKEPEQTTLEDTDNEPF